MSDQGPGYGLREDAWKQSASPYGPGYGLREPEAAPLGSDAPAAAPSPLIAAPQAGLGMDPAHLAFLRAIGLQDFADSTNNQLAVDALNRRAGMSLQDLAAQGADARQGIADSAETRGLYRSGARLRAQTKQQEGEARQASGIVGGTADQTASLIGELAQRRAANERERAEKSFESASRVVGGGL